MSDHVEQAVEDYGITETILGQFDRVRLTGRTNMYDRNQVQVVANDLNCYHLVVWIGDPDDRADRKRYSRLIESFNDWKAAQDNG